jgi:multiple sugar transport system permease protein
MSTRSRVPGAVLDRGSGSAFHAAARGWQRGARRRARRRGDARHGWILAAPFVLLLGVFTVYPIARSLLLSFQDYSVFAGSGTWVGFENYLDLMENRTFRRSMSNTLTLMAIVVPIQTVLALLVANALNAPLRGRTFFRSLYFLPYVTAPIAVGAVMLYLFGPDGLMSRLLHTVIGTPEGAWYAMPGLAFVLVVIVFIWTQVGFFALLYLAGLQTIDESVYEAARIDGATARQILWRITVPLLRPTTTLVVVMGVIITLQAFEQPYVLSTTGGALPGSPADTTLTMVMYLYTEAFAHFRLGPASAAAFVVLLLVGACSAGLALLQRRARL